MMVLRRVPMKCMTLKCENEARYLALVDLQTSDGRLLPRYLFQLTCALCGITKSWISADIRLIDIRMIKRTPGRWGVVTR